MQAEHVLWDWNGTLLNDAATCVRTLNTLLRSRGLTEVSLDLYREQFGFPVRDYYVRLGFDFGKDDWDALTGDYHRLYAEFVKDTPLRSGTRQTLDALKGRGVAMSVLSASNTAFLDAILRARNIRDYFDGIYGLPDFYAESKISAGKKFISDTGIRPENVLLVGDTVHDYEVAGELNCRCVLVSGGHQTEARLRVCGCPVVRDISCVHAFAAHGRLSEVQSPA